MSPNEPARNGITRRNFMKNTALTAGAVMVLSRGIGFAEGEDGDGSPVPDALIWKKYVTLKDVSISGSGTTADKAKESFYVMAQSANLTNNPNSRDTGIQHRGDVTGMTQLPTPLITSEAGTEAAPTPVLQPDGSFISQRTIPKGTSYLEIYFQ